MLRIQTLIARVLCTASILALPACSDGEGAGDGAPASDAEADDTSGADAAKDMVPQPDATPDAVPDAPVDVGPAAPYVITAFDDVRINSTGEVDVRNVTTAFEWRDGPFESVALVVDLASTCFPFEDWTPPPAGHNWPEDCDAFDRNFEIVMDDPESDADPPGIELVRAITPFGGPLHFEIDVTDLANGLPGAHRLRAHISTWSDGAGQVTGAAGGWNVTARFDITPGPAPRQVLAVLPLYDGSTGPMAAPHAHAIPVPEGTTSARVEYRVTGHGGAEMGAGCIGPAEEFCSRVHVISVDGEPIESVTPWRDDCDQLCTMQPGPFGDYCAENPCGHPDSVRAPRANWCPGSVTPPILWQPEALRTPGEHSFGWQIMGVIEGGSWRVSAVYLAFGS